MSKGTTGNKIAKRGEKKNRFMSREEYKMRFKIFFPRRKENREKESARKVRIPNSRANTRPNSFLVAPNIENKEQVGASSWIKEDKERRKILIAPSKARDVNRDPASVITSKREENVCDN